jgi:cyclopropane fatty-acyl-phospholipid synthase-like methyltransferase
VAPSDSPELRRRGRNLFEWFRSRSLRRDMTCIDYGCGRLRVGQHFIDYLDGGRYLGLDIVDSFYREGLARISGKVVARSQPRFLTISAEALGRARAMRPDLIFSTAVVQHVPPRELAAYFANIIAMMDKHSTAIVHFKAAPMTTRIAAVSWAHSPASLIAAISESDPEMHARIEDAGPPGAGFRRDALIFSRDVRKLSKWLRKLPAEAPGIP